MNKPGYYLKVSSFRTAISIAVFFSGNNSVPTWIYQPGRTFLLVRCIFFIHILNPRLLCILYYLLFICFTLVTLNFQVYLAYTFPFISSVLQVWNCNTNMSSGSDRCAPESCALNWRTWTVLLDIFKLQFLICKIRESDNYGVVIRIKLDYCFHVIKDIHFFI